MTGCARSWAIPGRNCSEDWAELTHPDDLEPNFRLFDRLLAGEIEHFTLDKRYLKKDGGIAHATIHPVPFARKTERSTISSPWSRTSPPASRPRSAAGKRGEIPDRGEACPDAVVMSDLSGQVLFASRTDEGNCFGPADSDELPAGDVFHGVIRQ